MANNLPQGWAETSLDSICSIDTGKWDANHASQEGRYRFYTCAYDYQFSDTKRFSGECIILPGNGANVGEVFFYDGDFDAYQRTYILSDVKINPKFVFYHLRYLWKEVNKEKQYGSATNYIRIGNFTGYTLQIPPLPEQHRIVAKLDAVMQKIESNKQRLEKIPKLLKRFRQSVLAAAVSGKLTEDWRAKNTNAESANELIKSILRKKNKKLNNEIINEYELELPDSWAWIDLNFVCEKITDGEHITPKFSERGVPLLSAKDVRDGYLDFTNTRFITKEVANKSLERCEPSQKDILMVSRGATVGRTAKINVDMMFCLMGSVLLFKPYHNCIDSTIVELFFKSPYGQDKIIKMSGATAQQAVYIRDMKNFIISLPPIKEQKEIVRRVERLFAFADTIEARYTKAKAMLDKLPQSILAKAFHGELVPQDPDDLPAPRPGKWFVYVLECDDGSHYKGHTRDILERWKQHARGVGAEWTAKHPPRKLVHWEEFSSENAAVEREKDLKTGFGRKWLAREIEAGRTRQAGEPASVLLARIKAEKEKSAKEKKDKKIKPLKNRRTW